MADIKREVVLWECENPECEQFGSVGIVGEESFTCPHCGRLVGHFTFVRKERLESEGGLTKHALDAANAFRKLALVFQTPRK